MKKVRDNSINFIAYVNSQDINDLYEAHDRFGHEFEVNDGYVTAVIFYVKEDNI